MLGGCAYCAAHRTLVTVVHAAREAASTEGVATGRGDRLMQQLQAQDALEVIMVRSCHAPLPAGQGCRKLNRQGPRQGKTADGYQGDSECHLIGWIDGVSTL
jgi:hypothetical protein